MPFFLTLFIVFVFPASVKAPDLSYLRLRLKGGSHRFFVFVPQVDHTALNTSLTSARKVKWLRERMISSSAEALLMNHIKEFILHDDPIDVEKLKACLRTQVQRLPLVHSLFEMDRTK